MTSPTSMANQEACASCASTQSLKRCARCSKVWYCSKACQRAHWKSHKPSCHYQVGSSTTNQPAKTDDALSLLRGMPDPGTAANALAQKLFNIIELRLAVFSELSASELLRLQRTCRSWYLTIALEPKLQQRLFMTAGPGELVCPARRGDKLFPGMQPRNESQRRAFDMEKNSFGPVGVHLVTNQTGDVREMSAAEVEKEGGQVILNPFFTSLWPQDPANMTLSPRITVPTGLMTASWRRMQLTSPPLKSLSMSLWYTKSNGAGNQLLPHTGEVASGVTLGHVADILVAQPKKLAYHWIQLHGQSWWLRSADAVVVPQEGDVRDQGARPGVYVNPSNQIAFPGFLGPTSLSFNAAESKSFLG